MVPQNLSRNYCGIGTECVSFHFLGIGLHFFLLHILIFPEEVLHPSAIRGLILSEPTVWIGSTLTYIYLDVPQPAPLIDGDNGKIWRHSQRKVNKTQSRTKPQSSTLRSVAPFFARSKVAKTRTPRTVGGWSVSEGDSSILQGACVRANS